MASLFKFAKSNLNDKPVYPWSHRKLGGSSHALPRSGHATTVIDHHFIAWGGVNNKNNTKKNMFMIDTNTLSASALSTSGDIPTPRIFPTLVTIDGFIILYGGEPISPGELWDACFYVLHTNTRQWSRVRTKGNLPTPRTGHSACVSDDGIMYVWGGHFQRRYMNDLCAFNVREYPSKADWTFVAYQNQPPEPRSGHISILHHNRLYIFGGINANRLFNDIWYLDLVTLRWHLIEAVGHIPSPREGCSAALVDDTIYIFGGKGVNGAILGDLCAFRIKNQRWYMFRGMGQAPSPRYGHTLVAIRHNIYVFGGELLQGKPEDNTCLFVLDCSKVKYPPDTDTLQTNQHSIAPNKEVPKELEITQPVHTHHLAPPTVEPLRVMNPEEPSPSSSAEHLPAVPQRPSREGATLSPSYRQHVNTPIDPHMKFRREIHHIVPPTSKSPSSFQQVKKSHLSSEERNKYMHEISIRDSIISEMRKKEQWWRTEVSIAKHYQDGNTDQETESAKLVSFDQEGKLRLFEQLVAAKAEVKRIRNSISKQIEPIAKRIEQAEVIRTIALDEAAYYKARVRKKQDA
ncbi:Tip elongation aberrant protein 1 [Choanephora cucurbitarum]|uniref:Tip elongation aberrant protein 1 n=1 Tax=Choanephora cucurbitarum TaxID=101091 RepID=A0A1C7NA84_9FUNG|nr:Tip elongation aberrant protein 1 [Choanephora cucurbitarum]